MQRITQQFDFSNLAIDERLALAQALRDSVENAPLTPAQKEELASRKKAMDNGEMEFYSWEEVEAHVQAQLGK